MLGEGTIKLTVFRHTEAENNIRDSQVYGHSDDGLTQAGLKLAKKLSYKFDAKQFDAIFCSDAPRAKETATHIFGDHYVESELLRERNLGLSSGILKASFIQDNDLAMPSIESWASVQERADQFIESIINLGLSNVAVISHKGLIRSLLKRNKYLENADDISLGSSRIIKISPTFVLKCTIKTELSKIISSNKLLEQKVVSIYGIGSLAKGAREVNDIDLNIIACDSKFETVKAIESLQRTLKLRIDREVDVNLIDKSNLDNNFINSELFVHKNRHSLLIYESLAVPCLLYGESVLSDYQVHYSDLIFESYKLAITQVHRMNKAFLGKDKKNAIKQAHKFSRYACEFALIFKGVLNPYIDIDPIKFKDHYPELSSHMWAINAAFSHRKALTEKEFALFYSLTVDLAKLLRKRLYLLLNHFASCKVGIATEGINYEDHAFIFPNRKELNLFKENYTGLPEYKKIL